MEWIKQAKDLKSNGQNKTANILSAMTNNRNSGKKKIWPIDIDFLDDDGEYEEYSKINLSKGKHIQTLDRLEFEEQNRKKNEQMNVYATESYKLSNENLKYSNIDMKIYKKINVATNQVLEKQFPNLNISNEIKSTFINEKFNKDKKKYRAFNYAVETEKMTKTKKRKGKTTRQNEILDKPRKLEYIDISEAAIPSLTVKKKKKKTKKKSKESAENTLRDTSDNIRGTAEEIQRQKGEKLILAETETTNKAGILDGNLGEILKIALPKNISLDVDITPTLDTEGAMEANTALAMNKKIRKKKEKSKN